MDRNIPTAATIESRHRAISSYIHRTPVLTSRQLNRISGAEIYFKCENFQKVGAFKARGAINAVLTLTEYELKNGVATHSSGNHGQALAWAAAQRGAVAYIVMPSTAPAVKKAAIRDYGAKVVECEPTLAARASTLHKVVEETGATFIHPFNDYRVIAGQATCARELLEDVDEHLDHVIAPVGGGGLLSGTALSVHYFSPQTEVVAGEPEGADDAYRSFKAGRLIPLENPNTIADGLLTSLGDKTFSIIQELVSGIYTVNDDEIVEAMRLIWERMKIVIEPSCAVPFAAVLKNKAIFGGKQVGVILTGGNVDLGKLPF